MKKSIAQETSRWFRRKASQVVEARRGFRVSPNLCQEVTPTGLNQVWVADLTYVRLRWEFVYLAVILDAFSRWVVGYALSRSLEASLTVAALRAAEADRQPPPGCLHHSDRGVQYACDEYVTLLLEADFQISMGRRGNPYDNAQAESFPGRAGFKTLKHEEVNLTEYRNLEEAAALIGTFLEEVYNRERLHSPHPNKPPAEFEHNLYPPQAGEKTARQRVLIATP